MSSSGSTGSKLHIFDELYFLSLHYHANRVNRNKIRRPPGIGSPSVETTLSLRYLAMANLAPLQRLRSRSFPVQDIQ